MKKSVCIPTLAFVLLFVLHHDFWNWGSVSLTLGFLPVGLAYHAGYSLVAALFWLAVTRYAWPSAIEKWADESDD